MIQLWLSTSWRLNERSKKGKIMAPLSCSLSSGLAVHKQFSWIICQIFSLVEGPLRPCNSSLTSFQSLPIKNLQLSIYWTLTRYKALVIQKDVKTSTSGRVPAAAVMPGLGQTLHPSRRKQEGESWRWSKRRTGCRSWRALQNTEMGRGANFYFSDQYQGRNYPTSRAQGQFVSVCCIKGKDLNPEVAEHMTREEMPARGGGFSSL